MADGQPLLPFLSQFFETPAETGLTDEPGTIAAASSLNARPLTALGTETLTETREQSDSDVGPAPRVEIAAFGTETTVRKPPRHSDPDIPRLVGGPLWSARVL
jgi:hypothetical protein